MSNSNTLHFDDDSDSDEDLAGEPHTLTAAKKQITALKAQLAAKQAAPLTPRAATPPLLAAAPTSDPIREALAKANAEPDPYRRGLLFGAVEKLITARPRN